jgi:hypothetical protein
VDDQHPPAEPDRRDEPVVTYEAAPSAGSEPDGPPPPPFVRARTRRRRIALAVAAALLVIGVPLALAIVSALEERDAAPAAAPGTEDAERGPDSDEQVADPDAGTEPDERDPGAGPDEGADGDPSDDPDDRPDPTLTPPDVATLDGLDAIYAQLLLDIDDSERTMMGFQDDVQEAVVGAGSSVDAVAAVGEVAGVRAAELAEVREQLVDGLDDAGAEQVRRRYLEHLDSWADYLAAIEEDPLLLIEGRGAGFTVLINATADAFARALESELPAAIDPTVERFAEGILDRGFRGTGEAQV